MSFLWKKKFLSKAFLHFILLFCLQYAGGRQYGSLKFHQKCPKYGKLLAKNEENPFFLFCFPFFAKNKRLKKCGNIKFFVLVGPAILTTSVSINWKNDLFAKCGTDDLEKVDNTVGWIHYSTICKSTLKIAMLPKKLWNTFLLRLCWCKML